MYKELLQYVVKNLVNNKDVVEVEETTNEAKTVLILKVSKEDMGRVIGKEGKISKAIRTLVKANAAKLNKRVNVEIIE